MVVDKGYTVLITTVPVRISWGFTLPAVCNGHLRIVWVVRVLSTQNQFLAYTGEPITTDDDSNQLKRLELDLPTTLTQILCALLTPGDCYSHCGVRLEHPGL